MKSMWIADPVVEQVLHSTFQEVDLDFSMFFEANSLSNEERLTGIFIKTLIDKSKPINDVLSTWSKTIVSGPWYVKLYYTDTTIRRGEKKWGADLAFVLDVNIPDKNEFKKAILLQAKKMQSRKTSDGIIFENYWRLEVSQAKKLLRCTNDSFYIFYNPNHTGLGIRILPATSLISLSKARGNSTILHTSETVPSTRRFADFMLYDFIGCWAGDFKARVLKIAEGSDEELVPSHIIRVIIARRPGVLD